MYQRTHDSTLTFATQAPDIDGFCQYRVFEAPGRPIVVVVTAIRESHALLNFHVRPIATKLWKRLGQPPLYQFLYVQHWRGYWPLRPLRVELMQREDELWEVTTHDVHLPDLLGAAWEDDDDNYGKCPFCHVQVLPR